VAKVSGPLFSMEARGKFGDVVFTQRGGQSVARKRTIPANPNSPLQQAVRRNLGSLSRIYLSRGIAVAPAVDEHPVTRIDRSTDPDTFIAEQVAELTDEEKDTWEDMQEFVGYNARRLSENLTVQRTKAA